jgi:TldD protein
MKKSFIEDILAAALNTGGDFAEVFIENKKSNIMSSTGGEIEDVVYGEEYGLGIRIFKDLNSVYVYTNDFSYDNLIYTAREAASAVSDADVTKRISISLDKPVKEDFHKVITDPIRVSKGRRAEIIREIYAEAKGYDKKISQVQASLLDNKQDVIIANSEGVYVEDSRTRCRISINVVAADGNLMNNGYFAPGAHKGFEFFEQTDYRWYAREAARIAVTMLGADNCPSGTMPVIIDKGFGGVIFHEACGHGLEATSVAKKVSVYSDKLGKTVAGGIVTAIDDGTIKNQWGSANFDDEGNRTQKNILIKNGILKNYLIDMYNSRRMGMKENGASRRQSYRFAPTSRMSNTYIAAGDSTFDEMISSIDYGLYAKNMGGGSVDPATGEFNFAVNEGYIIKNGKIERPVRGASLIGRGHEILFKIEMVGNELDFGQGMCGSLSGMVPTDVGQPAIKVSEIVVGGGAI